MFTSLYLTNVLPASIPSAFLNTMVTVGPSVMSRWMAMPRPITAARIGMIHTTEIFVRRGRDTVACGRSPGWTGAGMTHLPAAAGVPDQTRIEAPHRDDGQDHHRHEEDHPGPRLHRHERLQLHERNREGVDEHVQHRPPTDDLDHPVQPAPIAVAPDRAPLHRDQQVGQRDELPEGD